MENESDTQGDTQGDIQGVPQDVTQGDTQGDDLDKWIEYQVAVYPKITEYKNSMDDDFAFEEENGEQKGGPERWTRNSRGHSATYIRERKYHFARNGQQIEYQQECYI